MKRIFTELSPRRDEMAQLYAVGMEKKEIASMLYRSYPTVNTTLQSVYEVLGVRNRSELTIKLAERLAGYEIKKAIISACLLVIFLFGEYHHMNEFCRVRRRGEEITEMRRSRDEELV